MILILRTSCRQTILYGFCDNQSLRRSDLFLRPLEFQKMILRFIYWLEVEVEDRDEVLVLVFPGFLIFQDELLLRSCSSGTGVMIVLRRRVSGKLGVSGTSFCLRRLLVVLLSS